MEYVYASMLLHSAGKKIDEASVKKIVTAAGVKADDTKIKALVASLADVNIEEAIKNAAMPVAAAPAAEVKEEKKEAKPKEDDKKTEAEAAEGLGALFG